MGFSFVLSPSNTTMHCKMRYRLLSWKLELSTIFKSNNSNRSIYIPILCFQLHWHFQTIRKIKLLAFRSVRTAFKFPLSFFNQYKMVWKLELSIIRIRSNYFQNSPWWVLLKLQNNPKTQKLNFVRISREHIPEI